MKIDVATANDETLKFRALELLAHGVIPLEQWAAVFENPAFSAWPGLLSKAFSVWFPTQIDYLQGHDECVAIEKELSKRGVVVGPVFELHRQLESAFKGVLALFSIEEQLFLRDRRLHNVHGRLQLNAYEEHDAPLFDAATGLVRRTKFTADNYRAIMLQYYSTLAETSAALLNRMLDSKEFAVLATLHATRLKMGEHFQPLIEQMGVNAACGSS